MVVKSAMLSNSIAFRSHRSPEIGFFIDQIFFDKFSNARHRDNVQDIRSRRRIKCKSDGKRD